MKIASHTIVLRQKHGVFLGANGFCEHDDPPLCLDLGAIREQMVLTDLNLRIGKRRVPATVFGRTLLGERFDERSTRYNFQIDADSHTGMVGIWSASPLDEGDNTFMLLAFTEQDRVLLHDLYAATQRGEAHLGPATMRRGLRKTPLEGMIIARNPHHPQYGMLSRG